MAEDDTYEKLDTLEEYEAKAKQKLPESAWGYFMHTAGKGVTYERNVTAYSKYLLRPKIMTDVSQRDLRIQMLNDDVIDMPICVGVFTAQDQAHAQAEVAVARAAQSMNTIMVVSTWAAVDLDEIATSAPNSPKWFQIHPFYDRDVTVRRLVTRAERAGYRAIVVTVDSRVPGREFWVKVKNGKFKLGKLHEMPNLREFGPREYHDPGATWEFFDWLQTVTSLPVVIKGVLTAEGAKEALKHGVSGIVVSTHGGRHLDGTMGALDALPEVISAVAGKVPVFLDSGVRSGCDVIKAIALGAKAVFVSRPCLWGLACGGEQGVRDVLTILKDEFDKGMGMTGVASVSEIDSTCVTTQEQLIRFAQERL